MVPGHIPRAWVINSTQELRRLELAMSHHGDDLRSCCARCKALQDCDSCLTVATELQIQIEDGVGWDLSVNSSAASPIFERDGRLNSFGVTTTIFVTTEIFAVEVFELRKAADEEDDEWFEYRNPPILTVLWLPEHGEAFCGDWFCDSYTTESSTANDDVEVFGCDIDGRLSTSMLRGLRHIHSGAREGFVLQAEDFRPLKCVVHICFFPEDGYHQFT